MNPSFVAITTLPRGIGQLAQVATSEGFGMVRRLIDEYVCGDNRFSKPGERLCAALNGDRLIGIGGINVDPYYDSASTGRIRHVYVHPDYRGSGVGRRLMESIERDGEAHFDEFQLFTTSPVASRFYEALEYLPVDGRWKVTHIKRPFASGVTRR